MKHLTLYILFLTIVMTPLSAADYFRLNYKIEPEETFAEILKKFVKDNSIINTKSALVIKTKKKNPNIQDWRQLKAGDEIQLYIDRAQLDLEKYKKYEASIIAGIKIGKNHAENKSFAFNQRFKSSLFYMASTGSFNQKIDNSIDINFKQNSLLTLGGSLNYYPKESLFSTDLGLYLSTFSDSNSNINKQKIKIPPEIGFNLYEEYRLPQINTIIYGGIDYEQLSTFDLNNIIAQSHIYIIKNTIGYLTLGLSKSISFSDRILLTKLSFSQSFISKNSIHTDNYSGNKILLYLNYKFNDKFFIHSLLKYHTMTGVDKLSAMRIGIGVGYILF